MKQNECVWFQRWFQIPQPCVSSPSITLHPWFQPWKFVDPSFSSYYQVCINSTCNYLTLPPGFYEIQRVEFLTNSLILWCTLMHFEWRWNCTHLDTLKLHDNTYVFSTFVTLRMKQVLHYYHTTPLGSDFNQSMYKISPEFKIRPNSQQNHMNMLACAFVVGRQIKPYKINCIVVVGVEYQFQVDKCENSLAHNSYCI